MRSSGSLFQYPFTPHFHTIDGRRLAYVDEGSGPALVMVHGNPSWSYLYRNLITACKDEFRVIAPDHMGCGFSDKPQDYPYCLQQHIDNLDSLLQTLGIERCILVVHDWGGAIGMGWAGRHPKKIAGLVVLNTAAFRSQRLPRRIALCRRPILGPLLVRGLNGFAWPATFMAVAKPMPAAVKNGFLAPYDSWKNRVALLRFVQDIPLTPRHPSWPALVAVERSLALLQDIPMLLCWGGRDFCFDDTFFQDWRRRFPAGEHHYFAGAGHYLLEDAGEEVIPLIRTFARERTR